MAQRHVDSRMYTLLIGEGAQRYIMGIAELSDVFEVDFRLHSSMARHGKGTTSYLPKSVVVLSALIVQVGPVPPGRTRTSPQ